MSNKSTTFVVMNIAVNTRLLLKNRIEGIGRFAFESLKELVKQRPEDTFYFYFDRAYESEFIFSDNIVPVVVHPQARHPILWELWFNYQLPYYFKKHKIDVFFSPEFYLSEKVNIPQIAVFHDINYIHQPNMVTGWAGRYLRNKTPKFAQKACKILTVSEFSAQDISTTLKVNRKKLGVCYNGISSTFKTVDSESPRQHPFFLVFGAINARKNIVSILKAFDAFKAEDQNNHELVFIGTKMQWTTEMQDTLDQMASKASVVFLGRQSDEVACLYLNHAQALLYVSLFEGFGLPIIEAQQCGCPVVTSTTSCLPEISGQGALLVNPLNLEEITKAIKTFQIDSDKTNRMHYIARGYENVKRFKWTEVAKKINQTIDSVTC